jgi:Arc/MetJ-type ribon-helix-helix transcriptional regulator
VATAVRKILGGLELPSDERGNPIPVIFDQKLDAYLHERARTIKVEGGRTTASDIIRDALRTPLPSEVAKQGKALLKVRHERYGTARTTVVIPPSTIEELRIEMGRYSNRTNNLSVGALAELRVLHWATGQSDWVE